MGIAAVVWLVSRPASPPAPAPSTAATAAAPAKPVGEKPHWSDLKPAQQQALAPLEATWEELGPVRKQKWISIGNRLAKMKPDEKARVQERMREWVALSPAERKSVRENFARAQKKATPPGQRAAEWEQYQQLPDEAKKALADAAAAKNNNQVVKTPSLAQSTVKTPAPVKAQGHGLVPAPGTVPKGTVPPAPIGLPQGSPAIVPPGSALGAGGVAPTTSAAAPGAAAFNAPVAAPATNTTAPAADVTAPPPVTPAAPSAPPAVPNASK
ncbi:MULTISPECIES: DUF3106 domain-containing protein [unclassified Duganella]|uniref:DUF3106 domain-containing protein n=1 Tax=unclassified Duganella TaxID=2636909 RepID=UPI0006F92DC3|nr:MULTISPECIES: DUF3106 domain-containing protein [unclassified Duganella]KQV45879.1 hypothetical protein ASD07_15395 [Duganella sp. Root336D2]KRC03754.1 hypothetical protein ASE26_02695 [Duganella sp. Root198D2]